MTLKRLPIVGTIAFTLSFGVAQASPISQQTFDTDPPLGAAQASGVWYTDRFAPAGFSSETFMGDARLALELAESDGAGNRSGGFSSAFYDTQGRKFDTPGALSLEIDMYIDPAWASLASGQRVGGIWGTAFDATSTISFFPILEFIDGAIAGWDGAGFQNFGLPTPFSYGEFATLGISLDPTADLISYLVNGELLASVSAGASTSIENVILQGVNRPAADRTMYFDNFTASTEQLAPVVPVPAALPMLLAALGMLGVIRRRRLAA